MPRRPEQGDGCSSPDSPGEGRGTLRCPAALPRSPEHFANCLKHCLAAEPSLGGLAEQSSLCRETAVVSEHGGQHRSGRGSRRPAPTLPAGLAALTKSQPHRPMSTSGAGRRLARRAGTAAAPFTGRPAKSGYLREHLSCLSKWRRSGAVWGQAAAAGSAWPQRGPVGGPSDVAGDVLGGRGWRERQAAHLQSGGRRAASTPERPWADRVPSGHEAEGGKPRGHS